MKNRIKRSVSIMLCAIMLFGLIPMGASAASKTEITLWTFPIGGWNSSNKVNELIDKFEAANPDISVKVEYLSYADGDAKVSTAIAGGAAPDIVLAEPERIVSSWSKQGTMVDLSDMLDSTDRKEIYPNILNACIGSGNSVYMYPMSGIVHTMAINKTVFEAAGAMKYINQDTHTWKSTEDFFKALETVAAYTGNETVGVVYCGGQGGDQGTRALVTNLYGGRFTNATHTAYTWDSAENIKALTALYNSKNIEFDPSIFGGDEIALFYNGILNVAFCWNIAQQKNPNTANTGASKTASGDDIMFMAYPSNDAPLLQGAFWGFGIFDNGISEKIGAAKTFVKYMCDSKATIDAVKLTEYFPVRTAAEGTDLGATWESDPILSEYNKLMQYTGDYYQITPSWSVARTAWWNMLQEIGSGSKEISEIVKAYTAEVNATMPKQEIPDDDVTEGEFKDVPADAYYHDPVMWAVENGITTGTGDGTTFKPNESCTRGQVVTFLWRAAGKPEPTITNNPFVDVKSGDYFYKAVLWAKENNITSGTGDGTTFEPNSTCNRAQIVTFLSRAKNGQPTSSENPFKDVPAGSYYYNPVLWAVENEITTGTGDGTTFEPNSNCTRGQVITFLYRAYK